MRKDVRIGAMIGGILVGVLVVYVLVSSIGHSSKVNNQVVIDGVKSSPAGPKPSGAAILADAGSFGPGDHVEIAPPADPPAVTPAGGAPLTGAPAPAGTPGGSPAAGTDLAEPASASAAKWRMLLSAEHIDGDLDPLRSSTPSPAPVELTPPVTGASPVDPAPAPAPAPAEPSVTVADSGATGVSIPPAPNTGDSTSPPATAAPAAQTHKIQQGETFSSISRSVYGDAKYYKEIIKANPKVDPNHLKLGMEIALPDKATFKHSAKPAEKDPAKEPAKHSTPSAAAPVNPKTEYRVQSTDSLYKISLKLYHTANKLDAIYQLNKETIGSDPAKLKLNMVLKLPQPPTETVTRE